jgi:hypothetical protein
MSKKLFTGLAPLLAIVAFAAMPVAAQAEPHEGHYFKNSAKIAEGASVPVIGWGTLTLSSAAGIVSCHNAVGGEVGNPSGGKAGTGKTLQFSTWACTQTTGSCKSIPGVVETRVVATSLKAKKAVLLGAEGTGWPSVVGSPPENLEEEPFRVTSTVGNAEAVEAPVTGVKFECYVGGKFEGEIVFYGSSTPKNKNGTTCAKPTLVEFGAGSGELEALAGAVKGTTTGKAKLLGYEEQELITIA